MFTPHAGEIYAKPLNDRIRVLILTPINRICDDGWFCLGLQIYPNGTYGRAMIVSVHPDNTLCSTGNRLPKVATEALRRHRSIQRRARAAYVQDDTAEFVENGCAWVVRGV